MDDVLFGVKRAHLALNRWALSKLRALGITPARFDLMRMIHDRNGRWAQSELRRALGVARATISVMVRALVKLGWITREVNRVDRRTRDCLLTHEGQRVVMSVMSALVLPRVIAKAVDDALGVESETARRGVEWFAMRVVIAFALDHTFAIVTLG